MSALASGPVANARTVPVAVAPVWHTTFVLFVLLGLSAAGARSGHLPFVTSRGRALGYVLLMVFEWAVVAFIWYGVRSRHLGLGDLIGGAGCVLLPFFVIWQSPSDFWSS